MADPIAILGTVGIGKDNSQAGNVGTQAGVALGAQFELLNSPLQPRYFQNTVRRQAFHASHQAGQITTVGFATTYTGLCLSNPPGSGKLLVLDRVNYAVLVANVAAATLGLMGNYSTTEVTHTTPGTVRSNMIGANLAVPGVGKVDTAATLPVAPVMLMPFDAILTGAITTTTKAGPNVVDIDGSIILEPGGFVAIATTTVSAAAALWAGFIWHEISA